MPVSYYILFAGIFLVLLAAVPYVVYLFGMTFGKKPNEIKTGDTANLPDISIVVCAYNEERNIRKKIQSIIECSYPENKIELIIVNDASRDKTEEVARDTLKNVHIKWEICHDDMVCKNFYIRLWQIAHQFTQLLIIQIP